MRLGRACPRPRPRQLRKFAWILRFTEFSQGANSGAHIAGRDKIRHQRFCMAEPTNTTSPRDWMPTSFSSMPPGISRQGPSQETFFWAAHSAGPSKKTNFFFFGSYQGQRISDATNGSTQFVNVPCLDPGNPSASTCLNSDRSAAGIAASSRRQCVADRSKPH